MHKTVENMWFEYLDTLNQHELESISKLKIPAWHFCDNKKDADTCTRLVLSGKNVQLHLRLGIKIER